MLEWVWDTIEEERMNSEDGHGSEYSYISENSYDTIDELLKRFTLDYSPDYSLKLRDTYVWESV